MTQKSPQNQSDDWPENELVDAVKIRRPEHRTAWAIAAYNRGIITKSDLAFLSYVFGLGIRV